MNPVVAVGILTFIGASLGSILTYLLGRRDTRGTVNVSQAESLWRSQSESMDRLQQMVEELRDYSNGLRREVDECRVRDEQRGLELLEVHRKLDECEARDARRALDIDELRRQLELFGRSPDDRPA